MSKSKIALLISASAIGAIGAARVGVNGRIKEFPRGEALSVDPEVYEALKNSNEKITLLADAGEGADEGSPVVGGVSQGDGTEDGRPYLISAATISAASVSTASISEASVSEASISEASVSTATEDDEAAKASVSGATDADTGAAIYTGDVPDDLIRWNADDSETGKKAGAIVTKDDLHIIAKREGVDVETDDNKASLQAKIAAARAAAA